jgi:Protein of unknown function (DUF2948)
MTGILWRRVPVLGQQRANVCGKHAFMLYAGGAFAITRVLPIPAGGLPASSAVIKVALAMADLKLIALDAEDLAVVSAHLQDAILQVADLAYLPREKRFAAIANRFDWIDALKEGGGKDEALARRRTALRFERVMGAKVHGIDLKNRSTVLSLLAIAFEPADEPEGDITLHFSEGRAIRLRVECIEAELKDLGPVWQASSRPEHPDDPATG